MSHRSRRLACAGVPAFLIAAALAACGSGPPGGPAPSARPATPGLAGYEWQVVAIGHGGGERGIPASARTQVYLLFSRSGRFGANDGVNFHNGTYREAGNGFTTSALAVTGMGYAGHDPVVLLAEDAIGAFDAGVRATVESTGGRLVVNVGSYTLICQRHGPAGNNA